MTDYFSARVKIAHRYVLIVKKKKKVGHYWNVGHFVFCPKRCNSYPVKSAASKTLP